MTAPDERHRGPAIAPRRLDATSRLSDAEVLMWKLEGQPSFSSTWAWVSTLERPPDLDRLRVRLERTSRVVPRLRQVIEPGEGRFAVPKWKFDPGFGLDRHLRRVTLSSPGSDRQLCDLVDEVTAAPFDWSRPLWELTVVDGLEGGRAALVMKAHHAITDGEGAVQMSAEYIDEGRDRPERDSATLPESPAGEPAMDETAEPGGEASRANWGPRRLKELAAAAYRGARNVAYQLAHPERVLSPLWTQRAGRHRFDVLRFPFDDVHRASKALDGSINDLFVAAVAGAAGAYHRARGVDLAEVRVAVPVSTRRAAGPSGPGSAPPRGGNALQVTRVVVPAGPMDAGERVRVVQERLRSTRERQLSTGSVPFTAVARVVPARLVLRLARLRTRPVDLTASNIRGVPDAQFVAGARVEGTYPMGPLGGTAWNITILSSDGWMGAGLLVDTDAVHDPALLKRLLEESFRELLAAG